MTTVRCATADQGSFLVHGVRLNGLVVKHGINLCVYIKSIELILLIKRGGLVNLDNKIVHFFFLLSIPLSLARISVYYTGY